MSIIYFESFVIISFEIQSERKLESENINDYFIHLLWFIIIVKFFFFFFFFFLFDFEFCSPY